MILDLDYNTVVNHSGNLPYTGTDLLVPFIALGIVLVIFGCVGVLSLMKAAAWGDDAAGRR